MDQMQKSGKQYTRDKKDFTYIIFNLCELLQGNIQISAFWHNTGEKDIIKDFFVNVWYLKGFVQDGRSA